MDVMAIYQPRIPATHSAVLSSHQAVRLRSERMDCAQIAVALSGVDVIRPEIRRVVSAIRSMLSLFSCAMRCSLRNALNAQTACATACCTKVSVNIDQLAIKDNLGSHLDATADIPVVGIDSQEASAPL
jgi:hypothetical protein